MSPKLKAKLEPPLPAAESLLAIEPDLARHFSKRQLEVHVKILAARLLILGRLNTPE